MKKLRKRKSIFVKNWKERNLARKCCRLVDRVQCYGCYWALYKYQKKYYFISSEDKNSTYHAGLIGRDRDQAQDVLGAVC